MSDKFRIYEPIHPHFITSAVVYWIPVFCRNDYFRLLVDSFRHCIDHKGLIVHAYVLMPNHFHAICSQTEGNLSGVIGDLKKFTSKNIAPMIQADGRSSWLAAMKNAGASTGTTKLWQDHFHPEQVNNKPFLEQKIDYMHNNPIRAGYVANAWDWVYSSAGFYYNSTESPIPVVPVDIF